MKHLHSFAPKRLLAAAAAGVLSVCVLLPAGNVLAAETTTDSTSMNETMPKPMSMTRKIPI